MAPSWDNRLANLFTLKPCFGNLLLIPFAGFLHHVLWVHPLVLRQSSKGSLRGVAVTEFGEVLRHVEAFHRARDGIVNQQPKQLSFHLRCALYLILAVVTRPLKTLVECGEVCVNPLNHGGAPSRNVCDDDVVGFAKSINLCASVGGGAVQNENSVNTWRGDLRHLLDELVDDFNHCCSINACFWRPVYGN